MLALLTAHLVAAVSAPVLVRWLGRRAFLLLALVPASAAVWALRWTGEVMAGEGPVEVVEWVPRLGMALAFRLDTLAWLMTLLVGGIGAVVLVYSSAYFSAAAAGLGRFAGMLVAFAGSMLGLVVADDLLLLYVFWELTTITSYLLIGHYADRKASRRAAMQAVVVTTAGGLAMLVGLILLGEAAGTYRLSDVVGQAAAGTLTGPAVTVAVGLLLVGAATKSALVPFHFWLPAAMAAPTPVSAYLHAAAMVKAGVYLLARLAPGFAELGLWQGVVLVLGSGTLVLGGYRALRQNDLKLLLAFGTVSQLGLLVLLVGLGSPAAALAGLAMLGAHAMFKASLFLTVGVVDAATGTRDLRRLSGLARRLPATATVAALATASMIGLPPFAGWVAKEAALEAFLDGDGPGAVAVLAAVVVGSALTVAYGLRFWWGAFGSRRVSVEGEGPDAGPAPVNRRPSGLLVAPAGVLALLGLLAGLLPQPGEQLLRPHADAHPGVPGHLTLWAGVGPALTLTAVALLTGVALFLRRETVERWQGAVRTPWDADRTYRRGMRRLDEAAGRVTAFTQRGSLPLYLGTILLVLVALGGGALVAGTAMPDADGLRPWDAPVQALAGGLAAVAMVLAARARRRLKAVVLAGVSGYAVALLFLLHGAPDVALTQVLVETITLVAFVLVLRRLPAYFSVRPLAASRWVRLGIGLAVGLTVGAAALVVPGARVHEPVSADWPAEAYSFGGGKNLVNVALVDMRAWDTVGEISVLLVAATGVASLIFLRRRGGELRRVGDTPASVWSEVPDPMGRLRARGGPLARGGAGTPRAAAPRPDWLAGGRTLAPQRRSVIFEIVTRLLFHSMIVVAVFLLFSGHNAPGGGFSGGLVAGIALVVRYLAGGRYELAEAAPIHPGLLLGVGLFLSAGVGLIALLAGGAVLQSVIVELTVPLLGEIKLVTSLFFDIGVFLLVMGLVLDVLRSLGAEIDEHGEREGTDAVLAAREGDR